MKFLISKKHILLTLVALISLTPGCRSAASVRIDNSAVSGASNSTAGGASFQLDPGDRNYVLETFSINENSLDVLVTKTESGRYQALKEYWRTNQDMLAAIEDAAGGTTMTIKGASYSGPAPTDFGDATRMQAPVNWDISRAPEELTWVYFDRRNNAHICIQFNLSGKPGGRYISSITWYLAAPEAPRTGTYIFPDGTNYSLTYSKAPALPEGYSWYCVTVYPGS